MLPTLSTIRRLEVSRNRLRLTIISLPSLALEQVGLRETSTWLERTTVICAEHKSALTSLGELISQGPERGKVTCTYHSTGDSWRWLQGTHQANQKETGTVRKSLCLMLQNHILYFSTVP